MLIDDTPERSRGEASGMSAAIEIEVAGAVVRIAACAPPALVIAALQGLRA